VLYRGGRRHKGALRTVLPKSQLLEVNTVADWFHQNYGAPARAHVHSRCWSQASGGTA